MNYAEALSFTFRDDQWFKKIAIGCFLVLISFLFIPIFFLAGYYIATMRNVIKDDGTPLPDWSDLSKIFVDGLLGSIIMLVYLVVVGGAGTLAIVYFCTNQFMPEYQMVLGVIVSSLCTLIALTVFINFGLMQFAATENFSAAFDLSQIANMLKNHLGNFMAITIFSLILNAILLCASLGLFAPIANFWGSVVQAHLFGQYAKEIIAEAKAVPSN